MTHSQVSSEAVRAAYVPCPVPLVLILALPSVVYLPLHIAENQVFC